MDLMSPIKTIILQAFRQMLGAVVRLGLRNGVNYVEMSNIMKGLYVEIAAKEYGIKGRETNVSRMAMMTGLDRKEIKRIKDLMANQATPILLPEPDKVTRILHEWLHNPAYGQNKQPMPLSFDKGENSFSTLVHEFGGGVAPVTVLREFQRSQMVIEEAGQLKLVKQDYIPNYHSAATKSPEYVSPQAITQGSSMIVDHVNTIFHNLYREDTSADQQLDMRATHHAVDAAKVPAFYQLVGDLGDEFLERIDTWLEQNAGNDAGTPTKTVRLGAGVYSIEGENKTIAKGANHD